MCNIAGYVGTRSAAPILLEMLRAQEGLCGGYYSGIATIYEGKIYYAKLTGDVARLEALTDAAALPGTIGIIHSRSKSGGGDAWAHPFVCERQGEVRLAYVANGAAGCFTDRTEARNALTWELLQEGFCMHSREKIQLDGYPCLPDGTGVHMSDTMCQLIGRYQEKGLAMDAAMAEAFQYAPSEIVGLLLSLSDPKGIAWSRINMPMMLAFCDHGAYLASSAMGIPTDAREPIPLPPCSAGVVYKDRYTSAPFRTPPATVAPVTARVIREAYERICAALAEGPKGIGPLQNAIKQVFDPADCVPKTLVVYQVLCALEKEGRLKWECSRVPGAREDLDAPKTMFCL